MKPGFVTAAAVVVLGLLAVGPAVAQDEPSVEAVRQVLIKHPEIILEVLRNNPEAVFDAASAGSRLAQEREWSANIAKAMQKPKVPDLSGDRPMLGEAAAKDVMVVYTDFSCSACAVGSRAVPELLKSRPGTVRVYMKHYPSDEFSRRAAIYFEAIGRQDNAKAWEFERKVFAGQKAMRDKGAASLAELAKSLGVDQDRLTRDLADPALEELLKADEDEIHKFQIDRTPTYVVNGVMLGGALTPDVLGKVLDIEKKLREHPAAPAKD